MNFNKDHPQQKINSDNGKLTWKQDNHVLQECCKAAYFTTKAFLHWVTHIKVLNHKSF